jgi:hypothetical protein
VCWYDATILHPSKKLILFNFHNKSEQWRKDKLEEETTKNYLKWWFAWITMNLNWNGSFFPVISAENKCFSEFSVLFPRWYLWIKFLFSSFVVLYERTENLNSLHSYTIQLSIIISAKNKTEKSLKNRLYFFVKTIWCASWARVNMPHISNKICIKIVLQRNLLKINRKLRVATKIGSTFFWFLTSYRAAEKV